MEEGWEKTVTEQMADHKATEYELHETQGECEGTVFLAVKVTGMTVYLIFRSYWVCRRENGLN